MVNDNTAVAQQVAGHNMDNEIIAVVGFQFRDDLATEYAEILTKQIQPLLDLMDYLLERFAEILGILSCSYCKKGYRRPGWYNCKCHDRCYY